MDHTSAYRPLPKIAHHPLTFDRASHSRSEMIGLLDLVARSVFPSDNLLCIHVKCLHVQIFDFNRPAWLAAWIRDKRSATSFLAPRKQSMILASQAGEVDKRKGVQNTLLGAFFGLIVYN